MKNRESKYISVVNHVVDAIRNGRYGKGDWIPSISEFMAAYRISRSTVFQGINHLRSRGIIESTPGVGYYVNSTRVEREQNIFMLFNEFNAFKEELYNSFIDSADERATVDLTFHNYNRKVFETLLDEANGKYTTYIIMSGKFEGIEPLLQKLSGKVYLLDHFHPELKDKYSSVFQNFAMDTYEGLVAGNAHRKKYDHIIMVQTHEKEPVERYDGLCRFCAGSGHRHDYIDRIEGRQIAPGELYLVADDRDMVYLIKQAERQGMRLGKDFGIISYNETPLKEVLSGGITTLSTDFRQMGKTMAVLINSNDLITIENPSKLTVRNSI
jgi:DNA-binding transcriptional regulator YhcF (GntR family)